MLGHIIKMDDSVKRIYRELLWDYSKNPEWIIQTHKISAHVFGISCPSERAKSVLDTLIWRTK